MKKRLLFCLFVAGSAPVFAQKMIPSRQISRAEIAKVKWPSYARQNHGDYVAEFAALQWLLRNQGFYKGQPDGRFDAAASRPTERAIRSFQRKNGLKSDGIVGAQTFGKLLVRLQEGDRGDAVRALQTLLNGILTESGEAIYPTQVDGIFGARTAQTLREWQNDQDLAPDGVVGAQTWCLLFGGNKPKR